MRKNIIISLLIAIGSLQLSACAPLAITGAGLGVYFSEDRRSAGIIIEDQAIEFKAGQLLNKSFGVNIHVNINSFNRLVLLTGEVPDEDSKQKVIELVKSVANVKFIVDELIIGSNSPFGSRSQDALTTSGVKTRMLEAKTFQANHVKIVTENGKVYLMGLVKEREAQDIEAWVSTTNGVSNVIKVFEYID